MSLQTIVNGGFAGRLPFRHERNAARAHARVAVARVAVADLPGPMRFLETGLALSAIATAILIGLGH